MSLPCFLSSDFSGLQLVHLVHLTVAARLTLPLLSIGVGLNRGQEVAVLSKGCSGSGRLLQADGCTAGFSNGGAVVTEVVIGDRCFSPAGFTTTRLPLSPLPPQRCLGLGIKWASTSITSSIFFISGNIFFLWFYMSMQNLTLSEVSESF